MYEVYSDEVQRSSGFIVEFAECDMRVPVSSGENGLDEGFKAGCSAGAIGGNLVEEFLEIRG